MDSEIGSLTKFVESKFAVTEDRFSRIEGMFTNIAHNILPTFPTPVCVQPPEDLSAIENPLNIVAEEGTSVAIEERRQLYLFMTDIEFRYCLYKLDESKVLSGDDEEEGTTIRNLVEPLLKMDKSIFPDSMSFVGVGSCIFMVGGYSRHGNNPPHLCKKVYIYDTVLSTLREGPSLKVGKDNPELVTLGPKIFALPHLIYYGSRKKEAYDKKPGFEMLDTLNLQDGWCALEMPRLLVSKKASVYSVKALAAVYVGGNGGVIFRSVSDAGTYAYEVDKKVWKHVSDEALPFTGHAQIMPHYPSLCRGHSSKSGEFCVYHICYEGEESSNGFNVNEIKIEVEIEKLRLSSALLRIWPCGLMSSAVSPNGCVYFVTTAVDKLYVGNRYVEVCALEFPNLTRDWEGKHSLKRCKKKKSRLDEDGEGNDLKGLKLKRCRKKRKLDEDKVENELKGLKLNRIWQKCYFGGSDANPMRHVDTAIAMQLFGTLHVYSTGMELSHQKHRRTINE